MNPSLPFSSISGVLCDEKYKGNFAEAAETAKAFGFEVIKTDPHTLLLDLDTATDLDCYNHQISIARESFGLIETDRWFSKSGRGIHVMLRSPVSLSIQDRLLLQACLGSDRKRELLGYRLLQIGVPEPSMLFKPKASLAKVAA